MKNKEKFRCHFSKVFEEIFFVIFLICTQVVRCIIEDVKLENLINNFEGSFVVLIILLIITFYKINVWRKTWIYVDDKSLVIERNTLNKKVNTISLANIDNVNSIIGVPNDFNVALKDLEYLKNNYNIDGYISRHWININNKKCNKASGIEYLKNKYNLENIYTVGDTVNDYLMIKNYKGYAMDVANNYIKEVSVSTISSLEELIKKISNLS